MQKKDNKKQTYSLIAVAAIFIVLLSVAVSKHYLGSTANSAFKEIYNVNEDVKLNNLSFNVLKVEKSDGDAFDKPQPGKEFIIITVKLKSTSPKDVMVYNQFDFALMDKSGQTNNPEVTTTISESTALNQGPLEPGKEVQGTIVFERPKNEKDLYLTMTRALYTNGKAAKVKIS